MNHRERFLCALGRKQPDKVPIFELGINEPIIRRLAKLLGIRASTTSKDKKLSGEILETSKGSEYVELYCDVLEKLDLDAISYPFSIGLKKISQKKAKDKYGRVYNLSPYGESLPAEPRVRNLSDAEKFDMASKLEPGDFSDLQQIVKTFGKSRAYCIPVTDPFKVSWRSMGSMENLLLNFRENPKLVHRLLRTATDFIVKAIDIAVDIGIDSFVMGGDFAHETGLLFSLEDYREYLKPLHVEIVEHVHQREAMIVKHSDGNVWALLDDWIEVGFDGLHPIQPQCMDIKKVKEYVSGKLAVLGNIDCRSLLVFGSEEEVKKTVKETIEKVAPGGGYIISSSNSIHPSCKAENYIAMVKATHQYGIIDYNS